MQSPRKVIEVRLVNGAIPLGGDVVQSVSEKHHAEMTLHPAGVQIERKGLCFIVPYGNIAYMRCEPADGTAAGPQAKQPGPEGKGK